MGSIDEMLKTIEKYGRPLREFKKGTVQNVSDKMKKSYTYILESDPGKNFDPEFKPFLTPAEILRYGVFDGKYLNDCTREFPAEWFIDAIALDKLRPEKGDVLVNAFQIHSRQPLSTWRKNNWVPHKGGKDLGDPALNPDERGWFQWYCRYWLGRRIPELDHIQIRRWKAFTRHAGQVKANCAKGDVTCRIKNRQALLQWAHNPFI